MAVREPLDFATVLRQYRAASGLTQEELAERANMSARGISDLERGVKRAPYRDTVRRLTEALQLSAPDRDLFEALARGYRSARSTGARKPSSRLRGTPDGVLVGRSNELRRIERCIEGEGPPLLFLTGEPGIGKTRLLHETVERVSGDRMAVLHAGCYRGSEHEAYSPIVDALAGYTRQQSPARLRQLLRGNGWLVRLLPELLEVAPAPMPLGALPVDGERRLLFSSVVRFLASARGASPAIFILDDLQWAGTDALKLLNVIVRSGEARVFAAFRDTDIVPSHPLAVLLSDLAHAGLADELQIRPLPADDAATLLDLLLTQPTDTTIRHRVLERCGGVPFYLTSCARDLAEAGRNDNGVPWSVAQSVRLRVSMLGGNGQAVMQAAAVAGQYVTSGLLTSATGLRQDEVDGALDAACDARLIDETEHRFTFSHDIVRDVMYADLGPAARASLHVVILAELEVLPAGAPERRVSELARHALLGGDLSRSYRYSVEAGDAAVAMYAYGEAEYYFRVAVDAAGRMGDRAGEADAAERLGRVLVLAGRMEEAVQALGGAAHNHRACGDVEGEGRAIAALATAEFFHGGPDLDGDNLRKLVVDLETREASEALCSLYITLTLLLYGPNPESMRVAERASEMARMLGDDNLYAEAEVRRGLAFGGLGRWRESGDVLLEAVALAEAVGDPQHINRALSFAGLAHFIQGKLEDAQILMHRAIEVAERHANLEQSRNEPRAISGGATVRLPFRNMLAYDLDQSGRIAFAMGDWTEARRCYERALSLERPSPTTFFSEYLRDLTEVTLVEGRWNEATDLLEELSVLEAEKPADPRNRVVVCLQATRELLRGNSHDALEYLQPILDSFYDGQETYLLIPPVAEEVCVATGDLSRAEILLAHHGELLEIQGNAFNTPPWLRVKGMLAARQGNRAEAAFLFERALLLASSMARPLEEGRVLREHGRLLLSENAHAARKCLERALVIFRALGAQPDAALTTRTIESISLRSSIL